mmetsp:Transcript_30759/g.35880  ORF Transcript_30759/g.35880 Transcript_30759/m.35880 type:complete len:644 (+) Transcript_30759:225-2156(+)
MSITTDAIHRLVVLNESENNPSFNPIVQVLKVMPVNNSSSSTEQKKRYRVILSDGKHHCQGMLATQHNMFVESGDLTDFSLVRITDSMKNLIQDRAVIILLQLDLLSNPGHKIGVPKDIHRAGAGAAQAGAARYNNNNNNDVKPETTASNPYGNNNNNRPGMNNYNRPTSVPSTSTSNPYHHSTPIARTNIPSSSKPITPIEQLNMYQNRWTIKARLTSKSQIRHWSNAKGEGQLFSMELLDSSSDIRATMFKEAVDKFYPMLEVDKVYTFSGGRLKAANMQYNTCKSSFEITFDQNAEICLEDDTGEIIQQSYNLVPIVSLENVDPGGFVDVCGVIKNVGEPGTIVSKKTGKELSKCELIVADDSGAEVSCTVWGDKAMTAAQDFAGNPVVAFRRARVSDYGGRTLSANGDGIAIRPRIPDAERLQNWWQSGGSRVTSTKSLSSTGGGGAGRFPKFEERKTVAAIKGENLGYTNPEKPDWISFKGTFNFIKSDKEGGAWYTACPNAEEPCKNRYKVTMGSDGSYYCERCQQNYNSCLHRYIFSATIGDDTSTTWVSIFDDQARVLLNQMTADEMYEELNGDPGQSAYDGYFAKANFTDWIFTCKVKQEMNQDEMRIKTSVHSLHPVDYAKEGRSLLDSILAM